MTNSYEKLATLLRTDSEVLSKLDHKMIKATGKEGVIDKIVQENDVLVDKTLSELGLTKESHAEDVYHALLERLIFLDGQLFELLGRPNLFESEGAKILIERGMQAVNKPRGLFLKKEKAEEMLRAVPPENILNIFGYKNIDELLAKESLFEVYSSLRFLESQEWMNQKFIKNYESLTIDDFEERDVEVLVLQNKWIEAAEKFMTKKYHNLSHLKELGVIFIVPVKIGTQGETTRLFTLLLHYLNEVPFYSSLFRRYGQDSDFSAKLMSLLRGDVSSDVLPNNNIISWRIVQRYLAKDDKDDPRLFEPHVNPEAEHWYKAEQSLASLALGDHEGGKVFGYWQGMDFVGDFFDSYNDGGKLISFDLIDLTMSLIKSGEIKYLYHQQEALWNKIFVEYYGRDKMNELIDENIIKGYIQL